MTFSTLLRYGLCVALLSSVTSRAAHLSPEAALQRAAGQGQLRVAGVNAPSTRLAITVKDRSAHAAVYVMESDSRYVVLPADDCAPAVLGYGDNFDADNIPADMQWWLDCYADQIEYMKANGITYAAAAQNRAEIPYLVTTIWNQSAPFNNLCPTLNGSRSVTGCVATAMSQVIYYHRCPAGKGTGTHSYTWQGKTLSFDYGATTFDWNNMKDSYKSSYTTAQGTAVATLMYGAGVSVNMNYSPSASGAFTVRIPGALVDNFGFDPSARYLKRDYFSAQEWDDMMYAELEAGRPVIYAGQSSTGGHCFVCDGYRSDGYYHINWGWGGTSDGYFLLSALNPNSQGIGGSSGGYNSGQEAVIGVKPLEGEPSEMALNLMANGGFEFSTQYRSFWFGQDGTRTNGFFNYSSNPVTLYTGVALTGADRDVEYLMGQEYTFDGLSEDGSSSGTALIRAYLPFHMEAGEYKASPVVLPAGGNVWQPVLIPYGKSQYVTVRVAENGACTLDGSSPEGLDAPCYAELEPKTTEFVPGQSVTVYATMYNPSGNSVNFSPALMMTDSRGMCMNDIMYYTLPLTDKTPTYSLGFTVPEVPDGVYNFHALDYANSRWASEPVRVYVGTVPTSVSVNPVSQVLETGDSFTVEATVLPADAFDTSVTWSSSNEEVATVDSTGTVTAVAEGDATITATTINGLTATVEITVTVKSGIADVTVDARDGASEVYDINGCPVSSDLQSLTPGVYLVKRGNSVSKQLVR
ncbi:MAG: C10 family peptidase [Muribaculaceae bacterium]|nr:C10 family peptidase [Muribaculaceae bacterium]